MTNMSSHSNLQVTIYPFERSAPPSTRSTIYARHAIYAEVYAKGSGAQHAFGVVCCRELVGVRQLAL